MNKEIKSWIRTVLFSILIAIVILQFFSFFLVSGKSMDPTLENNDYLIVKKPFLNYFEYKRNDIIVFETEIKSSLNNKKDLVKRIIAIEGDRIQIENGQVYLNEKLLNENYIVDKNTDGDIDLIVAENSFFVMGDNREVSFDSRYESIGLINKVDILGKVIVKMLPFKKIGDENNEN
ncbi:signal peptidase I [Clostridiaceae bacterium HSG29]|nr:signal peptidase I [Clostridiaceae bacterium HSG29]